MISLVVLWTDAALWLLGLLSLFFLMWVRRKEPYRTALRRLRRQKLPVLCAGIVASFLGIAGLDSIHLRRGQPEPEVVSLLDVLLSDLRTKPERTYSAPLATRQLSSQRSAALRGEGHPRLRSRHLLGTDKVGQDVLYRALKGCRVGLLIGVLALTLAIPIALFLGILAGYLGGRVDALIQYLTATVGSIPGILLVAAVMLIVEERSVRSAGSRAPDVRLFWLCVVLGLTSWTGLLRVLRGEVYKLREQEYVKAALDLGIGQVTILLRHILPNVLHIVIIHAMLRFSGLVLAEIVLSYIGIGVDPAMESWGNMVSYARTELVREPVVWWNLAAAFLFTCGLVLPVNLLGDAVRDALDPHLRTE